MLTKQPGQRCGKHKCCCRFPWVTLVITASAFAVSLPPATQHKPLAKPLAAPTAHCLPLVVNTSAPFTRHQLCTYTAASSSSFSILRQRSLAKSATLGHCALQLFLCAVTIALEPSDTQVFWPRCLIGRETPSFFILDNLFRWIPKWGCLCPKV